MTFEQASLKGNIAISSNYSIVVFLLLMSSLYENSTKKYSDLRNRFQLLYA